MSKVVGDIAVTVGADVSGLLTNMQKARRSTKQFGDTAGRMSVNVAKAGVAVVAAAGAMGASFVAMQRQAAEAAVEVGNLSRVANATPREFQRMAAAAETVNISQQKLSDILKDVTDRVGDFLETGGGPMADFFEQVAPKVGVTADEFARLSGPQALQLYVKTLEEAGASQQQMTFYLEAMASDATALLPLLRDNGTALQQLGDRAEEVGRILSNETIRQADSLKQSLDEMGAVVRNQTISALVAVEDELAILHQFVADYGAPALASLVQGAAAAARWMDALAGGIANVANSDLGQKTRENMGGLLEMMGGMFPGLQSIRGQNGGVSEFNDAWNELQSQGEGLLGSPVSIEVGGGGQHQNRSPLASPASSASGGGSTLPDLERQLATERELVLMHYEETMSALEEYRERKLEMNLSYDELEKRALEEKNQALEELDRRSMEARHAAYSGALGDMSALMTTESRKLFEIGKVAASAQAALDGKAAAVSAWEKGMRIGGPPTAAAFTAASLAKTGALLASINATSFGGGSGSSSAAGGTSAVATAEPASVQRGDINVYAKDGMTSRLMQMIFEDADVFAADGGIANVNIRSGLA
ncbi:hypothetical protein [Dinoroseobacter sp. S375]|uniref:hypothetical protein n=1 Tax=Dinoroseobacter sp. S375 TaxID=3415136 RepID=UPI003C7CBE77